MKIVVDDGLSKERLLFPWKIIEQDLTDVSPHSENWRFFWVESQTVNAILDSWTCTGTEMTSGLVGLKFLLKMPHRQTIDLWEQVVSC